MPEPALNHVPKSRGRPEAYPWDEWEGLLASSSQKFIQGIDFNCTPESFVSLWGKREIEVVCNIDVIVTNVDIPESTIPCVIVSLK